MKGTFQPPSENTFEMVKKVVVKATGFIPLGGLPFLQKFVLMESVCAFLLLRNIQRLVSSEAMQSVADKLIEGLAPLVE